MQKKMEVPAVLHALLSIRRPHGGTGEAMAQKVVQREARDAGYNATQDRHGNLEVRVGNRPDLIFTAHLDTVHRADGGQVLYFIEETKELVADGLDGKASVLGADDASGVFLLTEMIKAKKPGRYLFFVGEECGGIGSSAYVLDNPDLSALMVVSFDRKGTRDIITHQAAYETASPVFARALATALNLQEPEFEYKPCNGGMYTDSKEFAHLVPECTNVAVGYYGEHTPKESQDLEHLLRLRDAIIKLDWEALPIDRVPVGDTPWYPTGWEDYPAGGTFTPHGKPSKLDVIAAINDIRKIAWEDGLEYQDLLAFTDIVEAYVK